MATMEPMAMEHSIERTGQREAVAGLVLGIVSILLGWTMVIGLACGIVGLILSVKGRARSPDGAHKGIGTAGIVTSIIGIIWGVASTVLLLAAFIAGRGLNWSNPYTG